MLSFNKLKKIIVSGYKDFYRNGWLSVATIIVIAITLFMINTLVLVNFLSETVLSSLQDKIDITIQIKSETSEDKIFELKDKLEQMKEVKSVSYTSQEKALENFREAHKNDEKFLQSIQELDTNPLFASLNIKARQLDQYAQIDRFISDDKEHQGIIEKVNYQENQKPISVFSRLIETARKMIIFLAIIFSFLAILITFNTIRLAMYAHRREIEIMRLVGATSWYIRMPFIIEGILFGILGCFATLTITYFLIIIISPKLVDFMPEFNLALYFKSNLLMIIFLQLAAGISLGTISSLIAIRKYLRV
jgi:cell division transport system permease protein